MNLEKKKHMYVPVFGEERKNVWLGATRLDGMQSGEGE